ncbi:Cytochrome P450 monooxygenase, partial [Pseudocercospora fuligena]
VVYYGSFYMALSIIDFVQGRAVLGLAILGIIVLLFTYKVFVYPRFLSPLRHLPRPTVLSLLMISRFSRPPGVLFARWMEEIPNDGLIHVPGAFGQDQLLLTSPDSLKEVLVTKAYEFEKSPPARRLMRRVLGDGLILVEGDSHRFLRKMMQPSFAFRPIKELYPVFWEKSLQLGHHITRLIGTGSGNGSLPEIVLEISNLANKATLDIIGVAAMDHDFHALDNKHDSLAQHYELLFNPTTSRTVYFALHALGFEKIVRCLPWSMNTWMRDISASLAKSCLELVRSKKEKLRNGGTRDHNDILSLLVSENIFTDEQLADQLLTFLAAGQDTTSSAFTWVSYLLAKHPNIQTALRQELHNNLSLPDRVEGSVVNTELYSTIEKLPLLHGVCNETLRLYPTVPITIRTVMQETTIQDQRVPAGTDLLIIPWAINRSSAFWGSQVDDFLPERWFDKDSTTGETRLNNNGGAENNFVNMTYLHGPRSCIGQGFAKAELKCMVAAFVGMFEIELADPSEEVVHAGVVTARPEKGLRLRLRRAVKCTEDQQM